MDRIEDATLIRRLTAGDRLAQRDFVERYFPAVHALLVRGYRLPDADAEEIAYDVLCATLLSPTRYRPERGASLRTWLLRVAANRAIDHLRRRTRHPREVSLPPMANPEASATGAGAESAMARLIDSACADLDEQQRQILWWWAYGFPHAQIADWTGKSQSAVRQIVCRARRVVEKRLGAAFTAEPEPPPRRSHRSVGGGESLRHGDAQ